VLGERYRVLHKFNPTHPLIDPRVMAMECQVPLVALLTPVTTNVLQECYKRHRSDKLCHTSVIQVLQECNKRVTSVLQEKGVSQNCCWHLSIQEH
jgi:hypothetical protein